MKSLLLSNREEIRGNTPMPMGAERHLLGRVSPASADHGKRIAYFEASRPANAIRVVLPLK